MPQILSQKETPERKECYGIQTTPINLVERRDIRKEDISECEQSSPSHLTCSQKFRGSYFSSPEGKMVISDQWRKNNKKIHNNNNNDNNDKLKIKKIIPVNQTFLLECFTFKVSIHHHYLKSLFLFLKNRLFRMNLFSHYLPFPKRKNKKQQCKKDRDFSIP